MQDLTLKCCVCCRSVTGKVILGNGQVLKGSAPPSQRPLGPLPIIYAANAAVDSQVQAGQCEPGSLDPKLVSGHIVVSGLWLVAARVQAFVKMPDDKKTV